MAKCDRERTARQRHKRGKECKERLGQFSLHVGCWSVQRANTGVLAFPTARRCPFIRPAPSSYMKANVGDTDVSEPADIVPDFLVDPSIDTSVEESLNGS